MNDEQNPYNEDRKVFAEAMLSFAKTPVNIPKAARGARGNYADLPSVVNIVRPALAEHGLYYGWQAEPCETGSVRVTCTLECVGSMDKRSSTLQMSCKPDGGSMNASQAVVSACTYAQRVTLLQVTGLCGDVDADGEGLAGQAKESSKLKELRDMMAKHPGVVNEAEMLDFYGSSSMEQLGDDNLDHAMSILRSRLGRQNDAG